VEVVKKYIISYLVLSVLLLSTLSACSGGTVTETVTSTLTETQAATTSTHEELSVSEVIDKVSPAVAHIIGYYGEGSGIVVDSRGYVLTN
jgi:S1-C subfamily serine protease